jgi:hypothetical protein
MAVGCIRLTLAKKARAAAWTMKPAVKAFRRFGAVGIPANMGTIFGFILLMVAGRGSFSF